MSGLFFGGLFWGILISLFGLSIVLRYAFNINIPFVRIFFGIIIILFGLKLVVGYSGKHISRKHRNLNYHYGSKEISVLFSSSTIDLSKYVETQKFPAEISVVFGNAIILVPDSLNLEITSTTVFGTTILPDRSYAGFGEDVFVMKNNSTAPVIKIETNTVFGRLLFDVVNSGSPVQENPDSVKAEKSY